MRMRTGKVIVFTVAAAWAGVGAAQGLDLFSIWMMGLLEESAAQKLKASCALAAKADETALRTMETRMNTGLADTVNRERFNFDVWDVLRKAVKPNDPDSLQKATEARVEYAVHLMFAKASVAAYDNIKKCITERRRVLTGQAPTPTPTQNVASVCATSEGPLRCTGTFTGTYQWQCQGRQLGGNRGVGKLRLFADGRVSLEMLQDKDELPAQFDRVEPAPNGESVGYVSGQRNFADSRENYQGTFSTVVVGGAAAGAGPARTVVGSGTYLLNDEDRRCTGTFTINR